MLRRCAGPLAALAVLGLAGCFVYMPAELQSVPAGESVRVRLSRAAAEELELIAPGGGSVVRGTLVRRDANALFVRVPIATRREGVATRPIEQEVAIAPGEILELELRRRSGGRTALFVGGTAAVAAMVVGMILTGDRDRVIRDDEPPSEIRLPLGR